MLELDKPFKSKAVAEGIRLLDDSLAVNHQVWAAQLWANRSTHESIVGRRLVILDSRRLYTIKIIMSKHI